MSNVSLVATTRVSNVTDSNGGASAYTGEVSLALTSSSSVVPVINFSASETVFTSTMTCSGGGSTSTNYHTFVSSTGLPALVGGGVNTTLSTGSALFGLIPPAG